MLKGVPSHVLLSVRIGDTVTTTGTHSLDWLRGASFEVVGLHPISVHVPMVDFFVSNEDLGLYLSTLPASLLQPDAYGYTDLLMRVGVRHPSPQRDIAWLGPGDIERVTKAREKSP